MAKFPWGDTAVPMSYLLALMLIAPLAIVGPILWWQGPGGAIHRGKYPPSDALQPVALVTIAYLMILYVSFGRQIGVKMASAGLPDEVQQQAMKIAERSLYNTIEQMPCFVISMWLHAVFVNPEVSVSLGWLYVFFRFLYGYFYSFYGEMNLTVELATQPNYAVLGWFCLATVVKCSWGTDLHRMLYNQHPAMCLLGALLAQFLLMIVFMTLIGSHAGKMTVAGAVWSLGYKMNT